ncbi:hypothetical protein JTB14_013366 [Gonioctena quinquepunctata]|nr:hypothetical protein JTB14_013366 [Gonioctena quinquepunctata]
MGNEIPAEIWYWSTPNYSKIKVFGCNAYSHIPEEVRNGKFESRRQKCRMVGYCDNGYRLWDEEKRTILRARDAIFDESEVEEHIQVESRSKNKNILAHQNYENGDCEKQIFEPEPTYEHVQIPESEVTVETEQIPEISKRSRKPPEWHKIMIHLQTSF